MVKALTLTMTVSILAIATQPQPLLLRIIYATRSSLSIINNIVSQKTHLLFTIRYVLLLKTILLVTQSLGHHSIVSIA